MPAKQFGRLLYVQHSTGYLSFPLVSNGILYVSKFGVYYSEICFIFIFFNLVFFVYFIFFVFFCYCFFIFRLFYSCFYIFAIFFSAFSSCIFFVLLDSCSYIFSASSFLSDSSWLLNESRSIRHKRWSILVLSLNRSLKYCIQILSAQLRLDSIYSIFVLYCSEFIANEKPLNSHNHFQLFLFPC